MNAVMTARQRVKQLGDHDLLKASSDAYKERTNRRFVGDKAGVDELT